jgi:hypothetical protein
MKRLFFLFFILVTGLSANAQQKIDHGGMNYFINPKPNTIIYHDTIFTGKRQFEQLFYRTANPDLIRLVQKHQSNKIAGQVLAFAGTIATILGIRELSSSDNNRNIGWAMIGGGFAMTLTGGYLTLMGQKNMQMAVILFNQQNHKAALGIGVADKQAGLVYKF